MYGILGFGGNAWGGVDRFCAMKRLFIFLALCLVGNVWASISQTAAYWKSANGYTGTTAVTTCQAYGSATLGANSGSSYSAAPAVSGSNMCTFTMLWSGNSYGYSSQLTYYPASCPAGTTLNGGSCVCNPPLVEQNGACASVEAVTCAQASGKADLFTGGALVLTGKPYCTSSGNAKNCGGKVTGAWALVKDGVKTWTLEVTYDGSTCTPASSGSSPTTTTNEAPTPCKGQPGTVNGVAVCIPFSGSNPPAQTVGSTNTTNSDGSKTSTTSDTSCVGSKCTTTTTTTTTPAGGGTPTTTTTTKEEGKDDFCTNNPKSPMCLESSFSGTCGAAPSCTGDAIQCAMVQEQYRRNCQLYEPDTDPNSAVNKALAGNDPGNVDAMKAAAAAAPVGVGSFDFNGRGWSRACPQDPTFLLPWAGGREWSLPFSKLCTPLGLAADVAVALTALGCALFVLRVPQG